MSVKLQVKLGAIIRQDFFLSKILNILGNIELNLVGYNPF